VLAQAVLRAARARELEIPAAVDVSERPGVGATGQVGTHRVSVGRPADPAASAPWAAAAARRARLDLASIIWISVDGTAQAALLVRDQLRPEAARTMRRLRAAGFQRLSLLTGDRVDNANDVARTLGLTSVLANTDPAGKVAAIAAERKSGVTVMVGDGVNDAPALAAADVGVALGSRGSTAAAQAADAVIVDDRIGRLADAVDIAQRAHRLAVQSAVAGTVLSALAMVLAALGWLAPAVGAVVQEGIDVAVILNALRALRAGRRRDTSAIDPLITRFAGEHDMLRSARSSVRLAADALSAGGPAAHTAVAHAFAELRDHVLPHERAEEAALYPALTNYLRDPEALMTMSRAHSEIERLTDRLRRHLEDAGPQGFRADQLDDLRATLYGLDAVLTLHFAQEDEALFTLSGTSS
jgi:soluble P-type ATPase/hemerythrin-like domain-containing protein